MIVVTGGCGFIGSNIVKALNAKGFTDILVVDSLRSSLKFLNLGSLTYSDYVHKENFRETLKGQNPGYSIIIHQGACSDTTQLDADYLMDNNYLFSKEVLNACNRWNIPLIYASSASVYGNGEMGFREELMCERPLNAYAFSKLVFDNHVRHRIASKSLDVPVVGLRYFNVYGPQENHKGHMASVIFHMYQKIKNGEPMRLFEGSDSFLRDFIYVGDVVKVVLHFMEKPTTGIFNCGTGLTRSFSDLAKIVQGHFPDSELQIVPFPDHLKGKYQAYTKADLSQLRAAGCDVNFMSLEKGISEYVELLRDNNGLLNSRGNEA